MIDTTEWIWHRGSWCRWDDATVHVSTHALHYGSSVYEGIRCYDTASGPALFRLDEHLQRFARSCRLLRMELPWCLDTLADVCREVVQRNDLTAAYIRPLAWRGAGPMGLYPLDAPVEAAIFAFPWGQYLGEGAIEEGVDAAVSSWRRIGSDALMPMGKIGGQYINNQLAAIEARGGGFAEAILLDRDGHVAEGSGQNLFAVIDGALWTPPLASAILPGITRASVLTLAAERGIAIEERPLTREMLLLADELFFTGTASEITPVRSLDRMPIADGRPGPVTRSVQRAFFDLVRGTVPDRQGWLTPIYPVSQRPTASSQPTVSSQPTASSRPTRSSRPTVSSRSTVSSRPERVSDLIDHPTRSPA